MIWKSNWLQTEKDLDLVLIVSELWVCLLENMLNQTILMKQGHRNILLFYVPWQHSQGVIWGSYEFYFHMDAVP